MALRSAAAATVLAARSASSASAAATSRSCMYRTAAAARPLRLAGGAGAGAAGAARLGGGRGCIIADSTTSTYDYGALSPAPPLAVKGEGGACSIAIYIYIYGAITPGALAVKGGGNGVASLPAFALESGVGATDSQMTARIQAQMPPTQLD